MKKSSLAIVVVVVAAACTSTSEPEPEATSSVPVEVTTTAPAVTTSSAPTTTTTDAAVVGAACLVGVWDLDSETFFADITDAMSGEETPGDFRYLDGRYRLALGDDGSVSEQREDWTFVVTTDSGGLVMTVTTGGQGTYATDGEELTLGMDQSPSDVEILVDGVPLDLPDGAAPAEIPDVSFTNSTYTCTADTMVVTADGVPSTWQRTG